MFVLVSLVLSLVVLVTFIHLSKSQSGNLERKFEILVLLRQILLLIRQHRSVSHQALSSNRFKLATTHLDGIYDSMISRSNELIAKAPFDNRPMYRILQLKLKSLHNEWDERDTARSQVIHGKAIRHCMFLMDEIAIAWLIETGREDIGDKYHLNWQQILDSMEVLTQFRISIQEVHYPEGMLRVKYQSTKIKQKLNQLSILGPLLMASPHSLKAMSQLEEIESADQISMNKDELYQLTSDISAIICEIYDDILSEMTQDLYQPLPRLKIA